jgi:hypothetical protein
MGGNAVILKTAELGLPDMAGGSQAERRCAIHERVDLRFDR